MKHGFVRVAAATPIIKVADCDYNTKNIIDLIDQASEHKVKLLVFPELCITGYTCGDLFLQETLLDSAMKQLNNITNHTKGSDIIVVVGFPFRYKSKLYNTAAVICGGSILGLVPKISIPNYTEFYEARHFTSGIKEPIKVHMEEEEVLFGSRLLFQCSEMPGLCFGVEICEDLWVPLSPGVSHCIAGATIIANLSASDEIVGKDEFRKDLVKGQSSRLVCGYIYANAGEGESGTDLVFAGHNIIAENGSIIKESNTFENGLVFTELDVLQLMGDRRRMNTYLGQDCPQYKIIQFSLCVDSGQLPELKLTRQIERMPFVPHAKTNREKRCRDIINIQAAGLKSRIKHMGVKNAIIGLSGGLDSTLALLVIERAFDLLKLDKNRIIAVTMPCFGTTERTYNNALVLADCIGATLLEIPIELSVEQHFRDIGHDKDVHDVTYENSQARERTQVLMDLANKYNGLVVGTGDMSELALGWTTYNGDHMSMYGVNASVPKTLVRFIVDYVSVMTNNKKIKEVLADICNTPISPELLPSKEGEIVQETEKIVGSYELNDFFMFYILRFGFRPEKIYRLATIAFKDIYDNKEVLERLNIFYRRFFTQQYKRSCMPDGPKVGSVSLSPRGDLRMPSDASAAIWLKELEKLDV